MRHKEIFVLKIVWRKSIASLHRLTQAVQRANLWRTAGDPTWVIPNRKLFCKAFFFTGIQILATTFMTTQSKVSSIYMKKKYKLHFPVICMQQLLFPKNCFIICCKNNLNEEKNRGKFKWDKMNRVAYVE